MYRYPFTPYPNSWYRIAFSDEIQKGDIKRVSYLGEELVIFRGEDGKANVLDAFCPHLGADLSVGGEVKDNAIACPFHGWQFDGNGQCVKIPYCDSIPKKAKLHSWPSCEKAGAIYFYYHPRREQPDFELPDFLPFDNERRWNRPIHNNWTIRMHIQEVAENAVDSAHFPKVHAYGAPPEIMSLVTDGPRFTVKLNSQRKGMNFVGTSPTTITYHGFGVVHAELTTYLAGKLPVTIAVLLTSTPVDQENVEVNIMARQKKTINPLWDEFLRPIMRREIHNDFKNDIPIWESKNYLQKPIMCRDDGPIGTVRKWARQFYDEERSDLIVTDKTPHQAA